MKMRMIKIRPELLVEALQGRASFTSNLPGNIELLDIRYDFVSKQVTAIISSDDFEDVAESYPPPEFNVIFRTSPKVEYQAATNVKTEFRSTEKTPVQPNRDTAGIEKEFSREQRNLLSFAVDGEYVTIKPKEYLENEWDEINETVRSLGGKWMKGNNGSYWTIRRK